LIRIIGFEWDVGWDGRNLPEDALHPSHDFVTGRVGGLVKVDNTGADVGLEVTLQGRGTSRDWCEVTGSNEHCAKTRLATSQIS